jgi:ribose transport system ATP-binding protein
MSSPEPVAGVPRLEVRSLSKTFAGVTVLDNAHLALMPGEIHGLVGQNGSGKSTLIKLVSGVHKADPGGEIRVDGQRIGPPIRPERLHHDGLSFVHQDLGLVSDLSVRENVRVGRHATRTWARWIDKRRDRVACRETFAFLKVDIDPDAPTASLAPSQRAAVAVARALQERALGKGVIVFDESSRAIPHEALPAFYDMVRLLASEGTSVLMVSHNLREVLDICDRVTVLRNGTVVESGLDTAGLTEADLTRLVLGRDNDLEDLIERYPSQPSHFTVTADRVGGGRVKDVSFAMHGGEVVGIIGTPDAGAEDLPGLLGGSQRGSGTLRVNHQLLELSRSRVRDFLRTGVAFIPQERARQGLAVSESIEDNVTIPHLKNRGHILWTGRRWRREETEHVLEKFDVQPPVRTAPVGALSGGNQQKVLFGKWLLGNPSVLVLDEPTQAVDVGARSALLLATRRAAQDGAAVVYVSAEVDDLVAVCDRVLVLRDGCISAEFHHPFTPDSLLDAMFAQSQEGSHD